MFKGHTQPVSSALFGRDGDRIVTASWDGTAKVWDARTGSLLHDLRGHKDRVRNASFSPDGTRIVTSSYDKRVKAWDAYKGEPILELNKPDWSVTGALFSPDGARIVTDGSEVTVWDATTGIPLLQLNRESWSGSGATFSLDGKRIVSGGRDGARVWDARTVAQLVHLKEQSHWASPTYVSFSPDGTRIVTATNDKTTVWDSRTGMPLLAIKDHKLHVECVSFSPDGGRIVVGGFSEWDTVKVWDARTDSSVPKFRDGNRVKLVPEPIDAEELEYRRFLTRPKPRRYEQGYRRAKRDHDAFAARFYLKLLPAPERLRLESALLETPDFPYCSCAAGTRPAR